MKCKSTHIARYWLGLPITMPRVYTITVFRSLHLHKIVINANVHVIKTVFSSQNHICNMAVWIIAYGHNMEWNRDNDRFADSSIFQLICDMLSHLPSISIQIVIIIIWRRFERPIKITAHREWYLYSWRWAIIAFYYYFEFILPHMYNTYTHNNAATGIDNEYQRWLARGRWKRIKNKKKERIFVPDIIWFR